MSGMVELDMDRSIRSLSRIVFATMFVLVGVAGGLAATINISGAIIASGTLVVDTQVKPVQHLKGGIVQEILVRDGEKVEAGQVLLRFDGTQARANLAIIRKRLKELSAIATRLQAERDAATMLPVSEKLKTSDPESFRLLVGEERLFKDRLSSREGRKSQLRERIRQLRQEAEGLAAQEKGKRLEIDLVEKELASLRNLLDQGIVSAARVYSLQRESARLSGELGNFIASVAQVKGRITETELQIIQIEDDHGSEVSEQLRQTQGDIGQFSERLIAAEDDLKRIDIRAPQAGVVDQLAIHSAGAVVSAGETMLRIVPSEDHLTAELRIAPRDIDQISAGQPVILNLSAFNHRDTPELDARISNVSADLLEDRQTGEKYYRARATIEVDEWKRLGERQAVQGMPVEGFVQTGERSVLAYLAKPMSDQIGHAFREN
ncbi:HlyD family type I secretion periplasmic adaptor subunit [Agrobacterium tumefaciens]|uniref:HlyD family type I secretion periplasmic adaptor subunit n=1 Tax=Agrobacterium tumefaciens TaxID=358 RepID=UPI00287EE824|nr:HlyD family type I secretion periplasmic adaptor subunit [Agrobacterium tumefaciens]MDS7595197.1 HlyD family type I secretion periplasmic adaptor subunit [Agrobacterium tumefaciens]